MLQCFVAATVYKANAAEGQRKIRTNSLTFCSNCHSFMFWHTLPSITINIVSFLQREYAFMKSLQGVKQLLYLMRTKLLECDITNNSWKKKWLSCHLFFFCTVFFCLKIMSKMNGLKIELDVEWIDIIHHRSFFSAEQLLYFGLFKLLLVKRFGLFQYQNYEKKNRSIWFKESKQSVLIIYTLCYAVIYIPSESIGRYWWWTKICSAHKYCNYFYYFTIKWCRHSGHDSHFSAILSFVPSIDYSFVGLESSTE